MTQKQRTWVNELWIKLIEWTGGLRTPAEIRVERESVLLPRANCKRSIIINLEILDLPTTDFCTTSERAVVAGAIKRSWNLNLSPIVVMTVKENRKAPAKLHWESSSSSLPFRCRSITLPWYAFISRSTLLKETTKQIKKLYQSDI